jgi:hypothetical protein
MEASTEKPLCVPSSMFLANRSFGSLHSRMGVPSTKGACALEYHNGGCLERLAGGLHGEVAYQGVDETADLSVQPLVVAEEDTQHLVQDEDELPVRQP